MQYLYLNKDFDDIDDYYEVEKIITRRNNGKNKLYLIKWFGYPIKDCTWEPISHLDKIKALVDNFDKNFPHSIDKRQLRKYLHLINKGNKVNKVNKRSFKNRNKIISKRFNSSENLKYNHIIINLEDSTVLNEKIFEEKDTTDESMVESIEISKEKNKENYTEEGSLFGLIDENSEPKLIKPIILW